MADDDEPRKRYPDPPRYTNEGLRAQEAERRRRFRERLNAQSDSQGMPEPPEAA